MGDYTQIHELIQAGEGYHLEFKESPDKGLIEKVGTGINRIKNSVAANNRSRVEFTYDDFFTVTFYRDLSRKATPETALKTGSKILAYLAENPKVTIKSLSVALNISDRAVKNHLNRLKREGLIKRIGPDNGGYWEVL